MKKYTASFKSSENQEKWWVVDAENLVLGRLATTVASRLRGKHAPTFTPHTDCGDWVVVINADKISLTGRKWKQKQYYHHSGYMGGIKQISAEKLHEKRPEDLVKFAVKGMLPKNRLGRKLFKKLKVYAGDQHPHAAQEPESLEIKA